MLAIIITCAILNSTNQQTWEIFMNSGYVGYSKSVRAVWAEEHGEYPATECARRLRGGVTAEYIRDRFQPVSWHHTSKFFNRTDYYDFTSISLFLQSEEGIEDLRAFKAFKSRMKAEEKQLAAVLHRVSRAKHVENCQNIARIAVELFSKFRVLNGGAAIFCPLTLAELGSARPATADEFLSALTIEHATPSLYNNLHVLQAELALDDLQAVFDGKAESVRLFRGNVFFFTLNIPAHVRAKKSNEI
ncbi:hypothetical protein LMED105_00055 [Limnobacter sp. MED105]|nr:hypothetical protein LMED105_00055 [Limnobacter sp. MED105]